jgi:hypothetical protein
MAADTEGQWEAVPAGFKIPVANTTLYDPFDATRKITDSRGLFVVHAALLYTGKILCFCGHVENLFYAPVAYLYDPRVPSSTQLKAIPMPAGTDLFCCHYVQLYDGRLLIIGGSQQDDITGATRTYHGSEGAKTVVVFDPAPGKEAFAVPAGLGQLAQGRWYPTVVMMGDGRALALSGRRESGGRNAANPAGIADAVEAISPKADSRTTLTSGGTAPRLPIYPGVHLAPDGNIYTTHTTWGQEVPEPSSFKLAVTATNSTWTPQTTNAPVQVQREEGMSVPLPVTKPRAGSQGRFLIIGGGQAQGRNVGNGATGPILQVGGPASAEFTGHPSGVNLNAAEILDTTVNPPTWTATPGAGLTSARVNGHCVLLPDATIAVLGGHNAYKWQAKANDTSITQQTTTPSLTVELFKPGVGFTVGAAMAFPRMYHSVALLLPDGRVWIAGGADPNEHEPWLTYPAGWKGRAYGQLGTPPALPPLPRKNGMTTQIANRKDYQIYKPPYLCKGLPQPTITGIKPGIQVLYGANFTVTTPQAASITHVAIMRPGCVTHHTDTEQRYIELDFAPPSGSDITVTMVPATDSNLVPPGYYMVWIIDNNGIPCANAKFIQIIHSPPWPNPPPNDPPIEKWPCIVATVSTGSEHDPDVVFLRAVRDELHGAGAGARRFARAVNRVYYAFSPQLARWIGRRPRWRAAMRVVVVRPGTRCIRATRRAVAALPARLRMFALVAMLLTEGALGLLALPVVIAIMTAHVFLRGDRG